MRAIFTISDLRPLRRVLKEIKAPLLILHGIEDKLVPYAAALEHHRLVPHSELVTFDGAHMLIFSEPQLMADSMDSFVERVESGTAKIREEADPIRIKTADQPFDYGNIPSAGAFAFLVAVTFDFLCRLDISDRRSCGGRPVW